MIKFTEKVGEISTILEVETMNQLFQYLDRDKPKLPSKWIYYTIGDDIPSATKIEVEWKDGEEVNIESGSPNFFVWESTTCPIVRYRVIEE